MLRGTRGFRRCWSRSGLGSALAQLGDPPVVLKRGAFLVDGVDGPSAPWRFMSDLDIVVEARDCEAAVPRIEQLGFVFSNGDGAELQSHHAPPLISPCGQFSVEAHVRLSGHGGPRPEEMRAGAGAVGRGLRVPSLEDRLAHAFVRAQLHNWQVVTRRPALKDLLDNQVLGVDLTIDAGVLKRLFDNPRDRWADWSRRRKRWGGAGLRGHGGGTGMGDWRPDPTALAIVAGAAGVTG